MPFKVSEQQQPAINLCKFLGQGVVIFIIPTIIAIITIIISIFTIIIIIVIIIIIIIITTTTITITFSITITITISIIIFMITTMRITIVTLAVNLSFFIRLSLLTLLSVLWVEKFCAGDAKTRTLLVFLQVAQEGGRSAASSRFRGLGFQDFAWILPVSCAKFETCGFYLLGTVLSSSSHYSIFFSIIPI